MFKESSLVVIVLVVALILAFSSFAVQNAYDRNNIDNVVESIETYTDTETLSYSNKVKLFTKGSLTQLSHEGKDVVIPERYANTNWTHGVLNYPILLLHSEAYTEVINLESQTSVVNTYEIKNHLQENWNKVIGLNSKLKDEKLGYDDFNIITIAEFCPQKTRVAFTTETNFINGSIYSVVGYFNLTSGNITITNIARGGFTHSEYGGDIGPFWAPHGCEFAYTLGDQGDTATYLYIDCSQSGNVLKIDGETLKSHLDLGDSSMNFPGFRDLKWAKAGNKLYFSTREQDNSDKVIKWVIDVPTSTFDLLQ